jgi:hypothetical protein
MFHIGPLCESRMQRRAPGQFNRRAGARRPLRTWPLSSVVTLLGPEGNRPEIILIEGVGAKLLGITLRAGLS